MTHRLVATPIARQIHTPPPPDGFQAGMYPKILHHQHHFIAKPFYYVLFAMLLKSTAPREIVCQPKSKRKPET